MFDLKCKRVGCEYNQSCNCTAKNVNVTQSTKCDTFKHGNKSEAETQEDIEEVEKIIRPPVRKNIKVGCKADCIFNEKTECTANGITVQTCSDKTCPSCCTYQPK